MNEDIIKKLVNHDQKFVEIDQRFDRVDNELREHSETLKSHTEQLELIAHTVINHSDRLDRIEQNMATKGDIRGLDVKMDKMIGLMERRDQEVTVIGHQMKDDEAMLERHEKDLNVIKPLVGIT